MNLLKLKLLQTLSTLATKLPANAQATVLAVVNKLAEKFGIDLDPDSVSISGDAIQNQTLTADLSQVDFDDGSGFSYQWQADGVNIFNATQQSYTLTQDDVGKQIGLQLTYTDENGNQVVLTSDLTLEVANVNDAVTGNVIINGLAEQGQTLTADTTHLADLDGLGELAYQWFADGVAIAGANAANYTLTQADVGKAITVAVNYTDGFGAVENVASAATAAVVNVNDQALGQVIIEGLAQEDQALVANTSAITDADGLGEFSYQWFADGVAIAGANAANYKLTQADAGKAITVQINYTDQYNTAEQVVSAATAAVANLNDAPEGAVVITGTAQENQILTANTDAIADADGLGQFNYQWLADGVVIDGATGANYTLVESDIGKAITVQVSYTDQYNTLEILDSASTAIVTADVDLYVPEQAIIELTGTGVYANDSQQNGGIQTIQTGEANDLLVINTVIDGLEIDLGENSTNTDNDVVDMSNLHGLTYTASTGALTDTQGNSLTIDNADAIRLDTEATTIVLDKGGDYNFIFAANTNDYGNNEPTKIKMIEGTGATNVGLFFEEYSAETPPTINSIQKLNMEMEFNSGGPNLDNVAELNFAEGTYSFNATAIEYGLIAALLAAAILNNTLTSSDFSLALAQLAEAMAPEGESASTSTQLFTGQVKVALTTSSINPVTDEVTAQVTGFRDNTVTVQNGDTTAEYRPLVIVDNETNVRGVTDLTTVVHTRQITPEEPTPTPEPARVNAVWDGAGGDGEGVLFVNEIDASGESISNTHAFYGFSELQLSEANDIFAVKSLNNFSDNLVTMGEKADSSDYDVLDLSALTTGANFDAVNGVLSTGGKILNIQGVEEIIGTNQNDTIVGDNDNNTIKGGGGNDTLSGGGGNDTFTGGEGSDSFVFEAANIGADVITDFNFNAGDTLIFNVAPSVIEIVDNNTVYHFEGTSTVTLLGVNIYDYSL
ncbi:calcium-binding protein [Legionella cardiaca]|uniref:Structural toxin protein RtxA n=1 Tax=Legionella cardiaca TaxID=1071983 RepID=A0ABY8AWX8_9GAMM|nr:hypothetical protein [Legionella cardiaca]WED43642.1 hypothetical protein PXX05_02375 [Legionella cardiaca]